MQWDLLASLLGSGGDKMLSSRFANHCQQERQIYLCHTAAHAGPPAMASY